LDGRVLGISVGPEMQWQRRRWMQGLSGTVVDDPPHTHTGVGMTRLGWKEIKPPINGLRVASQIGAGLGTKGPRGSGVI